MTRTKRAQGRGRGHMTEDTITLHKRKEQMTPEKEHMTEETEHMPDNKST